MYTQQSTLITRNKSISCEGLNTQKSIQQLDTCKNNFYEAFKTSDNAPLIIYPNKVKPVGKHPYLECELWEKAAVSIVKSSVIFLSADKRGLQLDCHAPNKRITLFVQWKEVGVMKPDKSHFDLFLGFIRQAMLSLRLKIITNQPNRVRQAILKVVDSILVGPTEQYLIGNNLWLRTGFNGRFDILKGNKVQVRGICLEQVTTKICNL